jgi:hypothetical protein
MPEASTYYIIYPGSVRSRLKHVCTFCSPSPISYDVSLKPRDQTSSVRVPTSYRVESGHETQLSSLSTLLRKVDRKLAMRSESHKCTASS